MKTQTKPLYVADLHSSLTFTRDKQDVAAIHCLLEEAGRYDSFFYRTDGKDYVELWGMVGKIPFPDKEVKQLI